MTRLGAALLAGALLASGSSPAAGQSVDEVALIPAEGTQFAHGQRVYGGELVVTSHSDGLALVERVTLDDYLAGIKEVPLDWPDEALAAQVVAARTYLAWTLDRGRSSTGSRYGFDICATTACQVYAGAAVLDDPAAARWLEAIERTRGQVLLHQGSPAQAMYHSTSGGQTEPIQDIFPGSSGRPYLVGAPSPGESSPYVNWAVDMPAGVFLDILDAAGVAVGSSLLEVGVEAKERFEGVWELVVTTDAGVVRVPVDRVRWMFNDHGPSRHPELLPARRPDGRRYPQAVLSYRFDVTWTPDTTGTARPLPLPTDDVPAAGTVRFQGSGWGHHVGMSQYGAKALADRGAAYPDILAHFYGGLLPQDGDGVLPSRVAVGLAWGEDKLVVRADGPFTLRSAGGSASEFTGGTWVIRRLEDGSIVLLDAEVAIADLINRLADIASIV